MSKHASICDSDGCKIGEMICQTCHKPITEGLFLNIDYHVSKRGNEDDYSRQWHQECSKDHSIWEKNRKEIELKEIQRAKRIRCIKLKAISVIKNSLDINVNTETGFTVITCYPGEKIYE